MLTIKNIRQRYLSVLLALLCSLALLSAQTPAPREYQIKAAFLFNFTQFVEWPATSFSTDKDPFIIGILGDTPFGSYLEELVSGEKVNGHRIVVQYFRDLEEIKICHILFINLSQTTRLEQVVAGLKGRTILTVSDMAGFLQAGGILRFFTKNNKILIQINPEAGKKANLVISSKLLRLSELFVPGKK